MSKRDKGGGKVWGKRSLPRSCVLRSATAVPRVPAQTLPAAGSSCQRFLLWTPQTSPSHPAGGAVPSAALMAGCESVSVARCWRGLYLDPGERTVGAGAPEPKLGRRGRVRKTRPPRGRPTPDDTLPAPDPACSPAAPKPTAVASFSTQSTPGLQSISRALVCATFSTPTLLSSHAWGSSTSIFLF